MIKIPEKFFNIFCKIGTEKTYHKDESIYLQDDSADSLYLILSGRVRVYTLSSSGRETTLEIIEKGRIFGESSFLSDHVRPTNVTAVNEVRLAICSVQDLIPILSESQELMVLLFQHLSETCNHLSKQIYRLTNYDSRKRIASFLLDETKAPNSDKGIINDTLPYSHANMAEILGLNRVTVSRVIAEFSEQSILQSHYGKIIIKDREKLKSILEKPSDL
ncbi:MAG: Crp/Fnr family transcriptional regulator [Bariatricus sp.]|nr:Crp/Fnr family transcriptional regulator [Bariatricus sp.]